MLVSEGSFDEALTLTLQISDPVTKFFDSVMVNSPELGVRQNRFNLLHQVVGLTNRVANLSKLAT